MKRLIAAAALALAACRHTPPPTGAAEPNVLLITIDTLRADRVGPSLTPAIESVAGRGARFTMARSAVPLTLPSHASIMTGLLPPQSGARLNGATLPPDRITLARLFHDAGYRTGAFVAAYVLNKRFGLASGFDEYDDRVVRDPSGSVRFEAERRGDAVVDAALPWLSSSAAGAGSAKPFFAWIHLYDPHAPYDPPDEYFAKAGRRAYEGEVAFADAQVGRVLDWLASSGRLESTIVAILGDHGEGLGDHLEDTHGMLAYDSTLRVPLDIAGPGVAPRTIDEPVTIVQTAATLLQLANRKPAAGMLAALPIDRSSSAAQPDLYAETLYPSTAGWHPISVLVDGRMKLILSSEPELYDLQNDPSERHDISASRPTIVDALRARALHLGAAASTSQTGLSSDAAERLRALGYVSGVAAPVAATAPNPGAHIAAWNTLEKNLGRLNKGDARGALRDLTALARANPDSPAIQSAYARAVKEAGRPSQAFDIYRRLVARWPQDPALYHDFAVAAAAAMQWDEAIRAEQASLALQPTNAAASNGLGLALVARGDVNGAVAAFERAVRDDPSNAVFWTNLGNARRAAGDADKAEKAYRAALEADPRSADAANGIGVLLVQAGKASDAIAWFDRALASAPDFVEARLNLGIAYQENGDTQKAIDAYGRVLADSTPSSREHQAASKLLATLGK